MEEHKEGVGENDNQASDHLPSSGSVNDRERGVEQRVTIVATRENSPGIRAEIDITAIWSNDGRSLSFRTHQYWATKNDREKGNLSLHAISETDWNPQWDEIGKQLGIWVEFIHSGTIQVNSNQVPPSVPISWYWRYDQAASDVTLLGYHTFRYQPPPLLISGPSGIVPGRTFTVTGTGAVDMATSIVVRDAADSNRAFSGQVLNSAGAWTAQVSMAEGKSSLTFVAIQIARAVGSEPSRSSTATLPGPATIIQPPEGATVRIEDIVFTGTTYSTANIVVVRNDNHWVALSEGKQETTSNWTRSLLPTIMLPSDELKVEAQQTFGGITYSQVRTFIVESYPIIGAPAPGSEQETSFTVSGTGGRPGATLYIQKDQDPSTVYGTTTANASNWSVQATLPPGRQTVTPEQVMGGVRSKPGVPRTYIVKPPKVTGLAASVDADSNLTLSGPGYQGAEVVIYLTNVSEPIATTPVTASIWSTVIKDWLPGSYTFDVKQRVPDSAGGWIESDWSDRLSLIAPVPVPRLNVEVSPEGIPRFYGTAKYWPNQLSEVEVCIEDTSEPIVPIVPVAGSGTWSSTARQPWEPDTYQVVARLGVAGQLSLWTSAITVIIPVRRPPPPTIDPVEDNGLSPWFRGNCAAGATVTLTFTHPPTTPVNATVSGPTWSHQRALPFTAGVVHGVSATQTVDGDTSLPVSTTFTLTAPTPQPAITYPPPKEETDSDLTVTGDNGKAGASMQLWDARDKKPLGHPVILTHNGVWSISLYALVIDSWFISAQQTHNNRPSEHSDIREFFVVVMPPEFLNPLPGSDLPRTSTLSGKGRPNGRVTVWCKGGSEPLLRDVLIGPDGVWEGSVTRAVGAEVLWATQTFEGKTSKPSVDVPCRFVPHAVVPESPLPEELLGKTVTVSGFAVPDDHITLKRGTAVLGETLVLSDRTWSITAKLEQPDGAVTLSVVASSGEFHSAPSEWVGQLGLYLPEFTKPAAGQWGLPVMRFAGLGKSGLGTLMSWYNPDVVLAESVPVTSDGWAATSAGPLAEGAHWCRFWQTLSTGTPISDCAESGRFDVRNESPNGS